MINNSYSIVVCENEIQANDIRLTYKKQSKINVLKIPKIKTLDNWIASEYQDYLMIEKVKKELFILNGIEEKIIWERIIRNDLKKRQENKVTDITNIAQQAINANRILSTYHIDDSELQKNMAYKEPKYFQGWRGSFQKECAQKSLITKYDFINQFTELQKQKEIIKNEKILFISLDKFKISHQKLFEAMGTNNEVINDLDWEIIKSTPIHNAFQTYDHEISAVVGWIKEKISKKKTKLLIMTPALERFQVKLQNEIDRNIQPSIFNDMQTNSILNTSLKRPLSAEPIIRAALILIKINENKLIPLKELHELMLFDNWIAEDSFLYRQYFANQLKESKKHFISLKDLQGLLKKSFSVGQKNNPQMLLDAFNIIQNNRDKWHKYNKPSNWNELIYEYLSKLNFGKISNLIHFENNNLKEFFKVLNQLNSSKVVPEKLELSEYYTYLEYYLENFVPNQPNKEAYIDIYGFYENPTKKYDAIWLMNMNDNFWPNKEEYNPFLSKKIQEKCNLFNNTYQKKFYLNKITRLSKLSPELSISFSLKDKDTVLSASPWNQNDINVHTLLRKQSISLVKHQIFIADHQAPAIEVKGELFIRGGRGCLENQNKCPAWAFYANRLGCSKYEKDEQGEVSKRAEGSLIHRALELFWEKCKSLHMLLSMSEFELSDVIKDSVTQALKEFYSDHNEMDSRLLVMQNEHLKSLLHRWLSEEKTRPEFAIDELEKPYEVKVNKIKFNITVDRIDKIRGINKLLIDYKTGKNPTSRRALFSDDLTDLQLPIYACFAPIKNLSGIAIGHINREKINLYGIISPDTEAITKQLNTKIDNPNIADWDSLLSIWRNRIEKIADQYLSGDASVTFSEKIDFTYCDILPLLRLAEKKLQFEQYD